MNPFRSWAAMAALPLVMLAGCETPSAGGSSSAGTTSAAPADAVIAVENAETVLRPGQRLWISQPSNGSTGYAWRIKAFDENILKPGTPFGQETRPTPSGPPVVGAPGETQWLFIAGTPGTVSLELTYGRPWEAAAAPARVARYSVIVR